MKKAEDIDIKLFKVQLLLQSQKLIQSFTNCYKN